MEDMSDHAQDGSAVRHDVLTVRKLSFAHRTVAPNIGPEVDFNGMRMAGRYRSLRLV